MCIAMQDTSIRDQNISFLNSCMRLPLYLDESQTTNKRIFCVDGASGYIGGAIVGRLLIAGNTVHGTICSNPQDTRYDPMRSMDGAKDRIHLFLADVSKKESFDEAICGCDVVIRVASPVSVRAQVEVSCGQKNLYLIDVAWIAQAKSHARALHGHRLDGQ